MSEAMPEVASCPVVSESTEGIDQLMPGERCSVSQEIDSVQAVTRCSIKLKVRMQS